MNKKQETSIKRRSDKLTTMIRHPNVIEVASKLSVLVDSVKCSICLEVMIQPARIKCGHTFCTLCIENAIQFTKADEGSMLRKFSGGSAKANCPLCKKSNITKRSITLDPVLEEKIKCVKELQKNIKLAAKQIGFDLGAVRHNISKNGTIEGRTGLTPKKKSSPKKKVKSSIKTTAIAEVFDTQPPVAPFPTNKTYSSGIRKRTLNDEKVARHFNNSIGAAMSSKIGLSVYDTSITDESPPKKWPRKFEKIVPEKVNSLNSVSSLSLHSLTELEPNVPKYDLSMTDESQPNKCSKADKIDSEKENSTPNSISSLSLHSVTDLESHPPKSKYDPSITDKHPPTKGPKKGDKTDFAKENCSLNSSSSLSLYSVTALGPHAPKHDLSITEESQPKKCSLKVDTIEPVIEKCTTNSKKSPSLHAITTLDSCASKTRKIIFTLGGKISTQTRYHSIKINSRKVAFIKMGNIAPKERLNFSVVNHSNENLEITLKGKQIMNKSDHDDPDKSGIVLETETSTSLTLNTQNTNSQSSINHQSLLNEQAHERPVMDDFDMNGEEEFISSRKTPDKRTFPETEQIKSQYDTCPEINGKQRIIHHVVDVEAQRSVQDGDEDPFSIESDEDLFLATPEDTFFKPLNTSTTKQASRILSQSPMVNNAPIWRDIINNYGASNIFENFEIALHGDFGVGIQGGELAPSKKELWQLLTGCGAKVYKSVNLFTFARGITGLCIVNHEKAIGYNSKQVNTKVRFFCIFINIFEHSKVLGG